MIRLGVLGTKESSAQADHGERAWQNPNDLSWALQVAPATAARPHLAAPGQAPPTRDEAPAVGAAQGFSGQEKSNGRIFKQPADDGKRFATLRAHLALKGYSLHRTPASDGPVCFFVTRWGLVRELRDIAAVRAFAEKVWATHA